MDIEKLTKETILKNMTEEQQKAVLDSVLASVQESKKARSQKITENIDLVMQALQKIEAKMLARVDSAASKVEDVAANVKDGKDGRDGRDGKDGKAGKDGAIGPKGTDGRNGKDGKDGRDGNDGVSVVNAFLDFDNSLVIELSNGKQINVGGILSDATAEKVRVVANGGGTSQSVLDALAALQTEIDNLIPSQTGNSGKYLTTNGSTLSWASIGGGAGLSYQGSWNASTNSPTLTSSSGTNGYYYIVSVAGTTNLNGVTDWAVGDWAIYNGSAWQKIDNSDLVTSVAGRTGAVTLSNSDVSGSAASGANSDITSMSGITGAIGTADYVAFDTAYSTTLSAGQLGWDGNNTLGLGMYGGNVVQHIGEDSFFYIKASSAITKGQVCMFTGSVGASGVLTAAPATGVTNGQYIMGIAAESISLNGFGLVQCFGSLRNVSTTGYSDGDILYYDSSVTGGFTKTYPTSGPIVTVAAVINGGSSGGGSIQIRVTNTQRITASTGISVSQNGTGTTITNSSPDQTVSLTGSGTTSISGTYPNFTITSNDQYTGTVTSVSGTSGRITSSGGTTPALDLATTAVSAGSYTSANITVDAYGRITSAANGTSGGVTSVSGTGTVSGISLSGTVTSSGSLTLGGSLDLSSPPAIGGTTPNTGSFSTLKVGSSSILGNSNADVTLGLTVRNSGATMGYLQTYNSNAGSNLKTWRLGGNSSGNFVWETVNDAYSSATNKATLDTNGNLQIAGAFVTNSQTVSANYTVPSGSSSHSAGPITISSGVTVTVSSGSKWVVL